MTAVTNRRPDHQRFGHSRGLAFACAIWASIVLLTAGTIGAGNTGLVSFSIDAVGDADVTSDTGQSYTDYRVPPPDPANCVQAEQTVGMFAVFNRQMDSSGNRCNPLGSDRQFRIAIDAVSACDRISQFYPTGVNVNPDRTCELFYNDDPRVRIERLFSNQTRTAVAFLTRMNSSSVSYEIRTDTDATVKTIAPNVSQVTYFGKAHLWEFGNGKTRAVADAFNLKHQMTFTRYPQ